MSSAGYYRSEAQRCRDLAAHAVTGSVMAARWLTIAAEYEMLAEALETSAPVQAQTQQQPMQQQQQKTTEGEK
jgi:hypothetical protein